MLLTNLRGLLVTFLVALFVGTTLSFPTGAPDTVCDSMTPKHGNAEPQTSPSPFSVFATPLSPRQVTVVLSSESKVPFKGFMLQARPVAGGPAIGSFINVDSTNSHTRNCSGGINNSLTHISSEGKATVEVTWQAPVNLREDIVFVATFVQNFHTFWVGVNSDVLATK